MLTAPDIEALLGARHADPFAVLGRHAQVDGGAWLAALAPGARAVAAVMAQGAVWPLQRRHADGVFEGPVPPTGCYQLRVQDDDGSLQLLDDAYGFGPVIGELDAWLLAEGTHLRPCEVLGALPRTLDGVQGTAFAVWAPNARRVSVVGDFNHWDGRRHPMRLRRECGVWEIFVPGVAAGSRYKFELLGPDGALLPLKADPYARQAELRPATASIVAPLPPRAAASAQRLAANAQAAPVSIYEVHLSSWRRVLDPNATGGNRWLTWDELADQLVPYALQMGFTHLELMPVSEHPFDGSWGYQTLGLFAPTARFGSPDGLLRLVDRAHAAGLGVILDWVPAHFPTDAHGLAQFDGTHLYEYADPREGFHNDWNTLIFNFGRTEVRNFLIGNALYWAERYKVDGLRVDAVASMLYRDYSRKQGQWIPNVHGGRENLEAIALLKRCNEVLGAERPQVVTLAEESTAFPAVSRPTYAQGLGFHYKWNMGWMHDTLTYMARDPIHRPYHHGEMSFGMVYAYTEHFVLPISHDEVVHGKGSLLGKMPGDEWQRFANLRAYLGYMWGHPGKKLLFMGCEFAQAAEWNHEQSLDWHLLEQPHHAGVQNLVRDLNHLYKSSPALYSQDFGPEGFEWVDAGNNPHSLYAFVRKGVGGDMMLVVCNFAPVVHQELVLGVPASGLWHERLNTDSTHYGGSNVGTPFSLASTSPAPAQGKPQSLIVTVPPLATVFWQWQGPAEV